VLCRGKDFSSGAEWKGLIGKRAEAGKSENMICAGQAECPEGEKHRCGEHVMKKGPQNAKVKDLGFIPRQ
jgi:hypothetical protein